MAEENTAVKEEKPAKEWTPEGEWTPEMDQILKRENPFDTNEIAPSEASDSDSLPEPDEPVAAEPEQDAPAPGDDKEVVAAAPEPTEPIEPVAPAEESWITDAVKARAASLGLSETELSSYQNEAELDRATAIHDRYVVSRHAQQQAAEQQQTPPTTPQPEVLPTTPSPTTPPPATEEGPELIDVQAFKERGYEDDSNAVLLAEQVNVTKQALFDTEKRLQELSTQMGLINPVVQQFTAHQQADTKQAIDSRIEAFQSALDQDADFFGQRTTDAAGNMALGQDGLLQRQKVGQIAGIIEQQMVNDGQQVPPIDMLVHRAKQVAFADEIATKSRQEHTERIAAQAKTVRPAPGRSRTRTESRDRSKKEPETVFETAQRISEDPDLTEAYNRMIEESGGQ